MNFHTLIVLLTSLENLEGKPVRSNLMEPAFKHVDGYLSRTSRDLIHWNRVTNKNNLYE